MCGELVGVARGLVQRHAAEVGVAQAEARRQVRVDLVVDAAARRARQVTVVEQVTCGQNMNENA